MENEKNKFRLDVREKSLIMRSVPKENRLPRAWVGADFPPGKSPSRAWMAFVRDIIGVIP